MWVAYKIQLNSGGEIARVKMIRVEVDYRLAIRKMQYEFDGVFLGEAGSTRACDYIVPKSEGTWINEEEAAAMIREGFEIEPLTLNKDGGIKIKGTNNKDFPATTYDGKDINHNKCVACKLCGIWVAVNPEGVVQACCDYESERNIPRAVNLTKVMEASKIFKNTVRFVEKLEYSESVVNRMLLAYGNWVISLGRNLIRVTENMQGDLIVPAGVVVCTDYKSATNIMYSTADMLDIKNIKVMPGAAVGYGGLAGIKSDSIVLAEGLKEIPACAMVSSQTYRLEIPESIKSIGKEAMRSSCIKEILVKGKLEIIHTSAIQNVTGLNRIHVPKGVKWFSDYSICNCKDLTEMDIADGCLVIGRGLLEGTLVEKIYIPKSVRIIGGNLLGKSYIDDCWERTIIIEDGNLVMEAPQLEEEWGRQVKTSIKVKKNLDSFMQRNMWISEAASGKHVRDVGKISMVVSGEG